VCICKRVVKLVRCVQVGIGVSRVAFEGLQGCGYVYNGYQW